MKNKSKPKKTFRQKLKTFFKRTFYTLLALLIMLTVATNLILRQDKFGKLPDGKRLERISLITPIIGQKIEVQNLNQSFENWWEGLE
ncbi:MAG: hypothetical protein COZ18_01935 [Flexibacter sp. CG_4_10_14_3_um_filter_32_15]|nr:MAG: hypothetical protein COZ18_01935 [Flexibacter sp. CG_4_10_14_3_um_filter_32_15]